MSTINQANIMLNYSKRRWLTKLTYYYTGGFKKKHQSMSDNMLPKHSDIIRKRFEGKEMMRIHITDH